VQSTFFIKRGDNKVIQDSTSYTKREDKIKKKESATKDPKAGVQGGERSGGSQHVPKSWPRRGLPARGPPASRPP
jgi:hypothetical protein